LDNTLPSEKMRFTDRFLAAALGFYAVCTLFSMAAMSIGAVILFAALLAKTGGPSGFLRLLGGELCEPWTRRYLYAALTLALACLASLIGARLSPVCFAGFCPDVHFAGDMAKTWYLFWPVVLAAGFRIAGGRTVSLAFKSWLLAFAALSVLGLFQYFLGWPRPQGIPGHEGWWHVTLFLGHHLSVSSIFIFPLLAAFDCAHASFNKNKRVLGLPGWFFILAAGAGTVAVIWTYSRIVWIAMPAGILLWILWRLPKKAALALAAAVVIAGSVIWFNPAFQTRFNHSMGVYQRQELWRVNMEFFSLRPVTGVGWHHNLALFGHYKEQRFTMDIFSGHAHNNMIEMLASTGLAGATAWTAYCLLVFFMLGTVIHRSRQGRGPPLHFAPGLFCAWIIFHINGITQVNFWESKVLHQIAWVLALSLLWLGKTRDKA